MQDKHKKLTLVLALSLIGLLLVNLTIVGAYQLLNSYGSVTLNPGEKYTVNIPFVGPSNAAMICGTAEQTDGTLLKDITVIVKYDGNESILGRNVTGSNGKYCVTLPEIKTSTKKFDIYLEYDNSTSDGEITLADNGYTLNFENNKVYRKSVDQYVTLTGTITNEYALVENGRFEIKVGYKDGTWKYPFGDYEKYFVNINPNEVYELPNEEVNISWEIPEDALPGEYKFLYKTSFNAVEKTSQYVYFNITN